MEFLTIGEVVNVQGIKGELRVIPLTDDKERYHLLDSVFLVKDDIIEEREIEQVRFHKQFVLLKLVDLDDRTEAESYKKFYVKIDKEDAVPLEENEYFVGDIYGLIVETLEGEVIGEVKDIYTTGSNDVYEVEDKKSKKNQLLLPAIDECIKEIDIENGKMIIDLLDGLRDLKED